MADLTKLPNDNYQVEDFARSMFEKDENIDMKAIYKSPIDIARLHVIEQDYRSKKLNRTANVLKLFLDIFKPASVSKDGIGREQGERMVSGMMTKKFSFSERLISNLAREG